MPEQKAAPKAEEPAGGVFVEATPKNPDPAVITQEQVNEIASRTKVGLDYRPAFKATRRYAIEQEVMHDEKWKGKALKWTSPEDAEKDRADGWVSTGKILEGDCLMAIGYDRWLELAALPVIESQRRAGLLPDQIREGVRALGLNPDRITIMHHADGRVTWSGKQSKVRELLGPGKRIG